MAPLDYFCNNFLTFVLKYHDSFETKFAYIMHTITKLHNLYTWAQKFPIFMVYYDLCTNPM